MKLESDVATEARDIWREAQGSETAPSRLPTVGFELEDNYIFIPMMDRGEFLAGVLYAHYMVTLSPQMTDFSEMAKLIIELTESRSEIVFEALPIDDPQVRQPDITRAKQLLEWEPEVDVREGLRVTIEHYAKVIGSPA